MTYVERVWAEGFDEEPVPMRECENCGGSGGGRDPELKCPVCWGVGEVVDR